MVIGVIVLLALSAGAALLVADPINARDLAVQRAAPSHHNRTVANAKAQAQNKAIAPPTARLTMQSGPLTSSKRDCTGTRGCPARSTSGWRLPVVDDILAAGVVASAGWITATGNTLCQDWNADGVSVSLTDQTVLEAGGVCRSTWPRSMPSPQRYMFVMSYSRRQVSGRSARPGAGDLAAGARRPAENCLTALPG